ncbi:MAG: hypothetical protein JXQ93_00180 [Flavobacteriaceae bacterium]
MSIATWNTQGSNPIAFILNQRAQGFPPPLTNLVPQFICLQEAGNADYGGHIGPLIPCAWNPAPSLGGYYQITDLNIGGTRYNGYHVPWRAQDPGNLRCSLAILWIAALGNHAAFPIGGWHDGNNLHRPIVWITSIAGNNVRVGCIHAPSGGNMPYITNALNNINFAAPVGGVVLAGDINMEPGDLGPLPPGFQQQNTGGMTHRCGRNLDYLFYHIAGPFANAESATNFVNSDHLQCRFA